MGATSHRQDRAELTAQLRREGRSWVDIARVFRESYGVNARVAFRWAHGWSQGQAASAWCERWPEDPKTFKNFSYWESWPESGHSPSLKTLDKLAQLYICDVAHLLEGLPGYHQFDPANTERESAARAIELVGRLGSEDAPDSDPLPLVQHLSALSIEELARTAITAVRSLPLEEEERRPLLVKLSAALSLAATVPEVAEHSIGAIASQANLAGIWHSKYRYPSGNEVLEGEHYVVLRPTADGLAVQSLPHTKGTRLKLNLALDPPLATGTWTEHTSPSGKYRGARYHGSIQLLIDPSNRSMAGKWVGFGRGFAVNTGDWTMAWVDDALSATAIRKYHHAV